MKIKLCFLVLTLALSILVGCKKDFDENKNTTNDLIEFDNGRLTFGSTKKFEETIKNLKQNNYLSLSDKLVSSIGAKNYSELFKNKSVKSKSDIFEDEEDLVDDIEFKLLLNEDNEIEVDGTVYKITKHGTFIYIPEKDYIVNQLVEDLDAGNPISEKQKEGYLYDVEPGVLRYDTFREAKENTVEMEIDPSEIYQEISYNPATGITEDISTHVIKDKHTIVGEFLQNTFGFSSSYTRKFSDSRRIKVKFSCPNFILFSYINAKVKYQKKNWIGWSGTNCEKLVLGWDGITYSFKNPFPLPNNNTTNPGGYNPNWSRAEINPPATNKTYLSLYIPGFDLKLTDKWTISFYPNLYVSEKHLNQAYKAAFKWLKTQLAPSETREYVSIIPNNKLILIGPEEFVANNEEVISKTFDYSIGLFKFNWNMSGSIGISNFSVKPMEFSIKNASIYGKAYNGSKCLGVRIEKH